MKISKTQLKQIIKEELAEALTISEYSSQSQRPGNPEKGSAEYLALTGVNKAGRAARKLKKAFAGSGEEEDAALENPKMRTDSTIELDSSPASAGAGPRSLRDRYRVLEDLEEEKPIDVYPDPRKKPKPEKKPWEQPDPVKKKPIDSYPTPGKKPKPKPKKKPWEQPDPLKEHALDEGTLKRWGKLIK